MRGREQEVLFGVVDRSCKILCEVNCISSQANKTDDSGVLKQMLPFLWANTAHVRCLLFSMYISSVSCKWKNGQAMKFGVQVLQKAPKNQTPAQGVSLVFGMREPVFRSFCGLFGWQSWSLRSFCYDCHHFGMPLSPCCNSWIGMIFLIENSHIWPPCRPQVFAPPSPPASSKWGCWVVGLGRKRGMKEQTTRTFRRWVIFLIL